MTILDCADSSKSTPLRDETLTSIQALALLNNKFNLALAQHFASDLQATQTTQEDQVIQAFFRLTGRLPSTAEKSELLAYAKQHGLENLCRLLYNLHEFVFVD